MSITTRRWRRGLRIITLVGGSRRDGGAAAGSTLGLTPGSRVERNGFMALMRGRSPVDREVLRPMGNRSTVAGLDLTISAPKSVSVLFAIADDEISKALLAAHERAVDAAVLPGAGGMLHPSRARGCGAAALRGFRRRLIPASDVAGGGSAVAHACGGGEPHARGGQIYGA